MSVLLGRSAVGFGKWSGLAETTLLAFKINKFFCQEKKAAPCKFFSVVSSRSLPRKMKCFVALFSSLL